MGFQSSSAIFFRDSSVPSIETRKIHKRTNSTDHGNKTVSNFNRELVETNGKKLLLTLDIPGHLPKIQRSKQKLMNWTRKISLDIPQNLSPHSKKALVKVQSYFRKRQVIRKLPLYRHAYYRGAQRRSRIRSHKSKSAVQIQKIYRKYFTVSRKPQVMNASCRYTMSSAALQIQQTFRRYKKKRIIEIEEQQESIVTVLQSLFRGYKGRYVYKQLVIQRTLELEAQRLEDEQKERDLKLAFEKEEKRRKEEALKARKQRERKRIEDEKQRLKEEKVKAVRTALYTSLCKA